MRKSRAAAVAAAIGVVAALLVALAGQPAQAKGRHGPVSWAASMSSTASTCAYAGQTLTSIKVAPPRVSMDKALARKGGRAQYVGVSATLQGDVAGRWKKVTTRPSKRGYAVSVLVHPRKLRSVGHQALLTFRGSALKTTYSAFRVHVTLKWYAYNGKAVRGSVSRTSATCVRVKPYVKIVEAGAGAACALMSNASVRCWGDNTDGGLGDGTTTTRPTPVTPAGLGSGVSALAFGEATGCAVVGGGAVRCWGLNNAGQLGDGGTRNSRVPVAVSGLSGARGVFFDSGATCAGFPTAGIECWGANADGNVGNKGTTSITQPYAVPGSYLTNVVGASAGNTSTCSVDAAQYVMCWGAHSHGQLGPHPCSTTLCAPVMATSQASAVVVGNEHACAIGVNGSLGCWGAGTDHQLGTASASDSGNLVTPQSSAAGVSFTSGVTAIAAHGDSTCAVKGGRVFCWGAGTNGLLGTGSTTAESRPTLVAGPTGVVGVNLGSSTGYAWDAAGHVWAWGENAQGEFGNGTTDGQTHGAVAVSIH